MPSDSYPGCWVGHPQLFCGKPVEHLFRHDKTLSVTGVAEAASPAPESCESSSEFPVLHAERFNDSRLGRALEKVAQMNRPFRRSLRRELQESLRLLRLDSTSFSLHGDYPDSVERQKSVELGTVFAGVRQFCNKIFFLGRDSR